MSIPRIPHRALLALVMLALAAMACNLGAAPPPSPTPIPLPSATPFVFFTATPLPTVAATITVPAVATSCFVRTDWPTYTVQSGDSVSSIAARTFSTVADLVAANCLANPNLIRVGQVLRVPRTPLTVTPRATLTPTATPLSGQPGTGAPTISGVTVEPAILQSPGRYQISLGQVTVRALGVTNATRVTFYIANSGASPTVLGEDTNLADGAAVPFTNLSTTLNAQIWAVASNASNQQVQAAPITVVYDEAKAPVIGTLTLSPASVDPARPGVQLVRPGAVLLSVSGVQNATKVSFYYVPNTAGASPSLLGEDTNLADGAGILWSVPSNLASGLVWAVASNAAGQSATTASIPVELAP